MPVKPERTFKESLTPKELVFLQKYLQDNFSTMADREKEILSGFLFSCLTGLRYSDICRVEYSHIKRIKQTLDYPYDEENSTQGFCAHRADVFRPGAESNEAVPPDTRQTVLSAFKRNLQQNTETYFQHNIPQQEKHIIPHRETYSSYLAAVL